MYPATAPALPIIRALAEWRSFPDRVEAIAFLREIARAAVIGYGEPDAVQTDKEYDQQDALELWAHTGELRG